MTASIDYRDGGREGRIIKKADVAWVSASNLVSLMVAVIIGLALPQFTSYDTYAGYREYTLFIGFSAILHLGFIQGISLRYGNLSCKELPLHSFRAYSRFLFLLELIITAILLPVCLFITGGQITPFFFVIINMFLENLRSYFAAICVFTGRFKPDSVLQLIYRIVQVTGFMLFLFWNLPGWQVFLIFTTVLNLVTLFCYSLFNTALISGASSGFREIREDIVETVKRGLPTLLGEQLSLLILGIDSIFARLFFDARQFSLYSFAVYIIVTAFTVINAANAVIFPWLKRQEEKDIMAGYKTLKKLSLILTAVVMIPLYLCPLAIRRFLPAYEGSIPYLLILSLTLFFRTLQGMACSNTMKALNMEREYLRCNLTACLLALFTDTAAYLIFRDLKPIAALSVVVYAVWFWTCDRAVKDSSLRSE